VSQGNVPVVFGLASGWLGPYPVLEEQHMAEKKQVGNVCQPLGSSCPLRERDSGFAFWNPYWYLLGLREGTCLDSALWIWQLLFLRLGLKGSKIRLVLFLSATARCFRQG